MTNTPIPQSRTHTNRTRATTALVLGAVLLLSSCGGDAKGLDLEPAAPSTTTRASSLPTTSAAPTETPAPSKLPTAATSPALSPEQEVLAAYDRYFQVYAQVEALPATLRPAALQPVAGDPQYAQVLKELAARDARSESGYGEIIRHPEVVTLKGNDAILRDCQDTSQVGIQDKAGKKLTVGLKGDLALIQIKRGADETWRVIKIGYSPAGSC